MRKIISVLVILVMVYLFPELLFDFGFAFNFFASLFGRKFVEKIFEIISKITLFFRYTVYLTSKIITGKKYIFFVKKILIKFRFSFGKICFPNLLYFPYGFYGSPWIYRILRLRQIFDRFEIFDKE